MAGPLLSDRVRERTATAGTGPLALSGAVAGYRSFAAVGDGNSCYYTVSDLLGNWEVGVGTYTAATTTLSRDTVLASSNAGAKVDFPAGTKNVWLDAPALFLADLFRKSADTLDAIAEGTTNKHLTATLKTYYNASYSHKLIEDGLSGLVKCNGIGQYFAVTDNSSHWNTAYGWGDHAAAGYALASNVVPYNGAGSDVDLGTHSFSAGQLLAASRLNLPNGANPAVSAAGDICLDTTDKGLVVHDGTADRVYAHPVQVLNFCIARDAAGWDNQVIPLAALSKDMPATIAQVDLTAVGTGAPTLAVNIEERAFGSYNSAGTAITASAMTATGSGLSQTGFSNAGTAKRAGLFLVTGASAEGGTVNYLMGTVYFTRDRT